MGMDIRLTPKIFFWISALLFGTGFRMGKTRPCEFLQIYRPISFIWQPILSAQGDLHGEIPENRFYLIFGHIWLFGYLARCAEHGQVGYP